MNADTDKVNADTDKKLSPEEQQILDKAVQAVKKNRSAFEKANEEPIAVARKELTDLANKLIADGNDDAAASVLKHKRSLDADILRLAAESTPDKAGQRIKAVPSQLMERLVGTWRHRACPHEFRILGDRTFTETVIAGGQEQCRGRLTLFSNELAQSKASNGCTFQFGLVDDNTLAVLVEQPNGDAGRGWLLKRVPGK